MRSPHFILQNTSPKHYPPPRQSPIYVVLDPLPALCLSSPRRRSHSVDHGVCWTMIFSMLLLPSSPNLLCGSRRESSISHPSLLLPPHSQRYRSYQSIFVKAKIPKKSIILNYLQEGYDIILCQELNSPPQVPMAFPSGMNCVRIYHNTTGPASGTAVVVGPSLSRYSQPLPTFKDTHGLRAAYTVTRRRLPTLATASIYCPPPQAH